MAGKYRIHTAEFKNQAVAMVIKEKQARTQVARNLDITPSLLDRWIETYQKTGSAEGPGTGKSLEQSRDKRRIKQLEKALEKAEMERDILKKAAAYFGTESV